MTFILLYMHYYQSNILLHIYQYFLPQHNTAVVFYYNYVACGIMGLWGWVSQCVFHLWTGWVSSKTKSNHHDIYCLNTPRGNIVPTFILSYTYRSLNSHNTGTCCTTHNTTSRQWWWRDRSDYGGSVCPMNINNTYPICIFSC